VTLLRNLDLALLAGALVVFLATDLPMLGWVVGACVWLMWRGVGAYAERRALEQDDPRRMVGITAGSMVGRGWLLGAILIVAGLAAGDRVGLSAAVLAVILFTVSFTVRLILRPFEEPPARRGAAHP
jgi:hypothetical protein